MIAIQPGAPSCIGVTNPGNGELFAYLGNGDGTFHATGTGLDLGVASVTQGVVGDFNGDGKLDLVLVYNNPCNNTAGLVFVPGNGDGTFGTPVPFSPTGSGTSSNLLVGDLTNNNKLDLIWALNNAVYLGNGDGTFKQIPLNVTSQGNIPVAIADLNGDGIPDLVVGPSIYVGNGDGTFQTTPLYTLSLPQSSVVAAAAVGDVAGNGNVDLLELYSDANNVAYHLAVSIGDGHGNFTQDSNSYYVGGGPAASPSPPINYSRLVLTRLNNQSSAPPNDQALDVLAFVENIYVTSLLNQKNPPPGPAAPVASVTVLQASPTSGAPGTQITLTATVTGINPTGSVTFSSGSNTLGTAATTNGSATLQTSFAKAGSYPISASYAGDSNNSSSASNTMTITIANPDFTVNAQPTSSTVNPGATATFTLTVTPMNGYSGTVKFTCGGLPSEATCAFSSVTVTPNGAAASTTLTVTTTAASGLGPFKLPPTPWTPIGLLALAVILTGVTGYLYIDKRNRRLRLTTCACMLAAIWLALLGCGGGSGGGGSHNSGTPPGTYAISVTAADSAGGPQHTATVDLVVQ